YGTFARIPLYAAIASIGIVIAAVYLMTMLRRGFHGPFPQPIAGSDLTGREAVALVPLVAIIVVVGLYPAPLLNGMEDAVSRITNQAAVATVRPAPDLAAKFDVLSRVNR